MGWYKSSKTYFRNRLGGNYGISYCIKRMWKTRSSPGSTTIKAGYEVRGTTRNPERLSQFDDIEVVSADYNDPDSVYEACLGADSVFYTRPSFEESHKALDFAATVGSAAKRANVRRLIYNTCCWGPPEELGDVGQAGYDSVKLMISTLKQAGVQTTTFQPVLFMDNLLTDWAREDIMNNNLYTYPHNLSLIHI